MTKLHDIVRRVTDTIVERSDKSRATYIAQMQAAEETGPERALVSCGNLAHAAAACPAADKEKLLTGTGPNIGIVSAYNDMLSAHQPLGAYPEVIKKAVSALGATAQFAGGVPAMCDGVTQGQTGMDLSLFSRDIIAQATAISLSHNVFDAAILLGVCDKIVPGLFIGAARFGHLPIAFLPAGPMPSGLPNAEKARIRQRFAAGELGKDALLAAEAQAYHAPGTCTFYGTANSNQMLMEIMGLHLPGSAFVAPASALRHAFVEQTALHIAGRTNLGKQYTPFYKIIDEKSIVNAIVGLHATGGSTNHTIHLIAMARAAGIIINWDDFDQLSTCVPLLARIYPNGLADVNDFHMAGGLAFLIRELIMAGLLHEDVTTLVGEGLHHYAQQPELQDGALIYKPARDVPADKTIVRPVAEPFAMTGGLRVLKGPLGRAVIKTSAVAPEHQNIEAPAIVFSGQEELMSEFKKNHLNKDFIAVIPYQGPKANGMPELHKLTPPLSVLQNRGFKVALVTDGRMSGASGAVPAAIHVTPEALCGGLIGKLKTGDILRLDAVTGQLEFIGDVQALAARDSREPDLRAVHQGVGRELFGGMRQLVTGAEKGAISFDPIEEDARA
ncbi:MAG: phosphogluconate dehydratase [bacterium]